MDSTSGSKKQRTGGAKMSDIDDLLGDLLAEDVTPRKKHTQQPAAVKPASKRQGSKDEDFYSQLATMAEDDMSDVSEADVNQMARSIADLDDMDADLFGDSIKRKGSGKGGSERSSKPSTPRRTGTPRSRTPRATSPQQRVQTPPVRVTSPVARDPSPTQGDTPTTSPRDRNRAGSGKRRPLSRTVSPPLQQPKPSTAPGKFSEIGSASDNLKPGMNHQSMERPRTVPKITPKYDFGEFDEDDPLAGLLSDEDDDSVKDKSASKKPVLKQQRSQEDSKDIDQTYTAPGMTAAAPIKGRDAVEPSQKRNLFDRPPTRSGDSDALKSETVPEEPKIQKPKPAITKKDDNIFSDDDEFLGGLGIEEKSPRSRPQVKPTEIEDEEQRPARSAMDQLLGRASPVTKHLETKERKEFTLDQKYKKSAEDDQVDDDFTFGAYQPSAVSTPGSRPTSKRSVRFQDDDIFGASEPVTRARSAVPKSERRKSEELSWLEMATGSKISPRKDQESAPKQSEVKPTSTPKKSAPSDWLGLRDTDDEEETEWMKPSVPQPQSKTVTSKAETKSLATKRQDSAEKQVEKEAKKSPRDWLGLDSAGGDDYLGLGKEIDPDTLLQSKPESPVFQTPKESFIEETSADKDQELFSPPPKRESGLSMSWQSGSRRARPPHTQTTEMGEPFLEKPDGQKRVRTEEPLVDEPGRRGSLVSATTGQSQRPQDSLQIRADVQTTGPQVQHSESPTTDFFSFRRQVLDQESPVQHADPHQQQVQKQRVISDYQRQQDLVKRSQPPFSGVIQLGQTGGLDLSQVDAESKFRKMAIEKSYIEDLLESTKKRYEDEIGTLENSYKSRIRLLDETQQKKEERWRDETENMMSQHLTRMRQLEQEKSDLIAQHYRKLEEFDREKAQDIDRLKEIHRNALDQLRKDHDESLQRLKIAKDQQIDVAASSYDTTKSLHATVELIQSNARDLGELHRKVDGWQNMGMDEREINLRSKDEQLKMLQERLMHQQEDNGRERKRLEELIARLESQLSEQTRMLDEERWKVKQEQGRIQSLQSALEEERRLWTEQQVRERANIERTRESLLEEQKSVLTQLHKERQSLAEERTQFTITHKLQREEGEQYSIKLAQVKAEFETTMKAISDEKMKMSSRKEDLQKEEEKTDEERRKLEREKMKQEAKEAELIEAATMLKEKSEEVDELYMASKQQYEEGRTALTDAQKKESEDDQRKAGLQSQLQMLRIKEKEFAEERLKLSKEKKEVENLKSASLCSNCRSPLTGGMNPATSVHNVSAPNVMTMHNGHAQPIGTPYQVINPALQVSLNSVEAVKESIKADRSVRMMKMEAAKDQKYLEEQSLYLYALKRMPYNNEQQSS